MNNAIDFVNDTFNNAINDYVNNNAAFLKVRNIFIEYKDFVNNLNCDEDTKNRLITIYLLNLSITYYNCFLKVVRENYDEIKKYI